jgi:murein L,D-transpeptidase YafK
MKGVATFLLLLVLSLTAVAETPADRVVIEKSARRMTLYRGSTKLHEYKIALGTEPFGAKSRQGDHRTPEGQYTILARNPQSHYYKSLRISYPNQEDLARARKLGVSPGGDIMIHGLPNGMGFVGKAHVFHDWTNGCIAITNEEMDEIWPLTPVGTRVEIRP